MKTTLLVLAAFLSLVMDHCPAHGAAIDMAFEVASIAPCQPGTPPSHDEMAGIAHFAHPGGRFEARATTAAFLLEWAFGILPAQHSSGPAWLDTDRYDILAKAEGNATEADMKLMAQALLAGRFHLRFHREKREMPVLILGLGRTEPKVTRPKEGEAHGMDAAPRFGDDQKLIGWKTVLTRFTVGQLNDAFARHLGRVIVDETGLKGEFDFTFELPMDEQTQNPLDASALIAALREQMGFTVRAQKGTVDYLVIDGVEKVAAGNE